MKIKQVSDLHLEFGAISLPNKENADVLILGGDILVASHLLRGSNSPYFGMNCEFREFIKIVCDDYENVLMVCGNHEHYHGNIDESHDIINDAFSKHNNFTLLENQSKTIGDVTFIGSTLWTDVNRGCPITMSSGNRMSDFSVIRRGKLYGYRKFNSRDYATIHNRSLNFISEEVKNKNKVYVATHHAPTFASVDPHYKTDHYGNGFYASNLSELILDNPQIKVWSHGHMHCNNDYMVGNCRIISNPRGYVGHELNPDFKEDFVVEL